MASDSHPPDSGTAPAANTEAATVPQAGTARQDTRARLRATLRERTGAVSGSGRTLWTLAVVAMALDVILTGAGLSLGLQERNPIALVFIESHGLVPAALLLKGGVLAYGYSCWLLFPRLFPTAPDYRNAIPFGLALPTWVAVGINASLIVTVI